MSWYNLKILDAVKRSHRESLPLSATGKIVTGTHAIEYLKRGCATFQMHTFFQLPDDQYSMTRGSKVERALHELLFHPRYGFIVGILELRELFGWGTEWSVGKMADYFRTTSA